MPRKPSHPVLALYARLAEELDALEFGPPAACVYNPLRYAWGPFAQYIERYSRPAAGQVLLLGMNPGPWGMVQTGVPFGEVCATREWLRIDAVIQPPERMHPARPILGWDCQRSEVSGARLWGWAQANFETPAKFFARFFVGNYCPLAFLLESGANLTPDKLPVAHAAPLRATCDAALRALVEVLKPSAVVGIGAYATKQAASVLADVDLPIGQALHPSPASPRANRDWAGTFTTQLRKFGIDLGAPTTKRTTAARSRAAATS